MGVFEMQTDTPKIAIKRLWPSFEDTLCLDNHGCAGKDPPISIVYGM